MNDNGEESNAEYQNRMTILARKVSKILDGLDLEESAVVCARVCGFALGQIPHGAHRDKIIDITMRVWATAVIEAENFTNAGLTVEKEQ